MLDKNIKKNICENLFKEIVNEFKDYCFSFSWVLYADKSSFLSDDNFKKTLLKIV